MATSELQGNNQLQESIGKKSTSVNISRYYNISNSIGASSYWLARIDVLCSGICEPVVNHY